MPIFIATLFIAKASSELKEGEKVKKRHNSRIVSTTLVFPHSIFGRKHVNNYTDVSRGAERGLVVNINCGKLKASLEHE